jgi:nucleoid DNA-binding protein
MDNSFNLSQCLVERYKLSQENAESFVSEIFSVVRENLDKDKIVKVKGLGTFKLIDMNARESVDVNTGERIIIEGRSRITFTPENALRDRINSPFAQFESIDIDDGIDFTSIDEKYEIQEEEDKKEDKELMSEETEVQSSQDSISNKEEEEAPIERLIDIAEPLEEEGPAEEPFLKEPHKDTSEKETTGAEEEKNSTEANTSDVHNPYCEELIKEGITHSKKIIVLLYLLLGLFGIALLLGAVYFGYKLGTNRVDYNSIVPNKPVTKVVVMKPKRADIKTVAATEKPDTTQSEKAEVDSVELMQAVYNKDARVRTGAYKIVGLAKTVKVQKGQTLSGISRAYLGEGMECYVEVYNGGKKEVKAGEEIKIPQLKLKKRIRK